MIGRRLSHYEILDKLGHGGMGEVYLAEDTRLRRRIALKILPSETAREARRLERFRREARTVAALNHPNIVTLHSIEEAEGVHFLTMELVEGETLRDLLARSGALELERIFGIAVPVAEALAAVHARGVVHRDLKPENLMVQKDGRPKILDFGIAKLHVEPVDETLDEDPTLLATRAGRLVGTVPYMSPEQLQSEELDHRSDIFSLGIILYEMATGRGPFRGDSTIVLATSILNDTPPPITEVRPEMPRHLARIVGKCLEKQRERRYQSARDLRNDLDDLNLEIRTGSLSRDRVLPPAGRGRGSRRPLWMAAAAAAAGAAIVGALWWGRPGTPVLGGEVTMAALITEQEAIHRVRISPDAQWVAFSTFSDDGPRIWAQRIGGGDPLVVNSPGGDLVDHLWSPDGQKHALTVRRGDEMLLQIAPAFGGPIQRTVSLGDELRSPRMVRWIADRIYFWGRPQGLVRYDLERGALEDVVAAAAFPVEPWLLDVSADERRVAYCVREGGMLSVWAADIDAGGPQRVSDEGSEACYPRWMGRRARSLVYSSSRSGQIDLWQVAVGGGARRQLTFSSEVQLVDDVSLDGGIVLFRNIRDAAHLWSAELASGQSRQLTEDVLKSMWPSAGDTAVAFQKTKPRVESLDAVLDGRIFFAPREEGLRLGASRLLVEDGALPHLSPSGQWLAYVRGAPGTVGSLRVREVETGRDLEVAERFGLPGLYASIHDWIQRNTAWAAETLVFVADSPEGRQALLRWQVDLGSPETLVTAEPGEEIGDLRISPDGRRLAYLASSPPGDSGRPVEVRARDLESGRDAVLWSTEIDLPGWLHLKGWLAADGPLLVLEAKTNPDWSERVTVLTLDRDGRRERLGTVDETYGGSARLDPEARTLYLPRTPGPDRLHNLFAWNLDDRRLRPITTNRARGVRHSGLEVVSRPAGLIFSRVERNESVWLLEFTNHTFGS